MIILRVLGRFFLALAFVVLLIGLASWLAGTDVVQPAGFILAEWNRPALTVAQVVVERYLVASLWSDVFVPLLLRPWWEAVTILFLSCLVIGGLLAWIGRARTTRRRRKSSFS